jgi:xanthine/uracil permease
MATGLAGVIGSVDFSLSAGIIMATGCASRFPMIPMGLGLLLCAFLPGFVSFLSSVPDPVLGALLLYVMVSQLSSGLAFLVEKKAVFDFETGVVVGLPIMLALVAVYLPRELVMTFPATIRPVLGNGFVLGTVAALVLEHLVFGRRKRDFPGPGAAGKGGNRGKSGENGENGAC